MVLATLGLLLAVGTAAALTYDGDYTASPQGAVQPTARPAEAASALRDLEQAVVARDAERAATLGGASSGAADLLAAIVANAAALEVADFTLRYVDETSSVSADGSWSAAVDMSWRFDGFDAQPVREEVLVRFDRVGQSVGISAFGGGDRRTPLWLTGPLEVRRDPNTLVLVAGSRQEADLYARRARAAVPAVRAVVTDWPGALVVEVPANAAALDAMLAAEPGTYANVAAVSTSVDGTLTTGAATHVFVNPDVYNGLGEAGEQVVMTHEATHIATNAPVTSGIPLWLLEGFADYVALRDTDLPISKTAGQILAQVRESGAPDTLPGSAEFDPLATHLGAAYEAAWVACLVVADIAGEDSLVRLYDDVSRGVSINSALRAHVGLDVSSVTSRWRQELERLADSARVAG